MDKKETHSQAIKRICIKWRDEQPVLFIPVTILINRLQNEERKQRNVNKMIEIEVIKLVKYFGNNINHLSDFLAKLSTYILLESKADNFEVTFETTLGHKGVFKITKQREN